MKYVIIILLLISSTVKAQSYEDSAITIQAPRVFAWWVTKSIEQQLNRSNFRMVDILKLFVADTTKPDSLFIVVMKAGLIKNALDLLISRPCELSLTDRLKIINNQKIGATGPAITGYTALQNQIVSKANTIGLEKNTAIWLRDWFIDRQNKYTDLYNEERNKVIQLVNY